MIIKYNLQNGDPFGINNRKVSKSTAIDIIVESDDLEKNPYNKEMGIMLFHHFESCLDFIMNEGFIILDIRVDKATIKIIVCKTSYILKRIEQPSDVVEFLKPYTDEFASKISWGEKKYLN